MLHKLTKREFTILIVLIVLLVCYVSVFLVIKPLQEKIEEVQGEILSEQRKLIKGQRAIKKAGKIKGQMEVHLERYKQKHENGQVMSSMLAEIEQEAGRLGLLIANLKPSKVIQQDQFNKFSLSLTIDSEFTEILHFIYVLQSDPLNFEVQEVRFEKGRRRKTSKIKTRLVLYRSYIP